MAYSKAKMKSSGDRASPCYRHSGQEDYQTNVYLYGLYYMFHLNTALAYVGKIRREWGMRDP
jgi:hypothetical protein